MVDYEVAISTCPEAGICSIEILQNKTMVFKEDNLGAFYPNFSEGKNIIVKFEYRRNEIANTQDGNYKEQIFIELDTDNIETEANNLIDQKVVFARWCYCKGQTGYYKVHDGNLLVKKAQDKTYVLILDFKIKEVPQVITKIQHVFKLE